MAIAFETGCLMTTVKNISGSTMTFSFLPPHGKELADDEEYSFYGDAFAAMSRTNPVASRRYHNAFVEAVAGENKTLQVLSTPSPVFVNADDDSIQILGANSTGVVLLDSCVETAL